MRKFLIKIALLVLVIVVIPLAIYIGTAGRNKGMHINLDYKLQLLKDMPSPRLIIVGGSNVATGFDSRITHDSLGINVLNFGTYEPVGLKFMTDIVCKYAREGDIVVFAPEYAHFFNDRAYGFGNLFPANINNHPEYWYMLNGKQISNIFRSLIEAVKLELTKNNHEKDKTLYNEYGDLMQKWEMTPDTTKCHIQINGTFNREFGEYFIKKLDKLAERCEVIVMPPFCTEALYAENREVIAQDSIFLAEHGHPYLGKPAEHTFPNAYTADSPYHAIYPGVVQNTLRMIADLQARE